mmetsp:Transcript_21786/g.50178  ORF Transcript_21786/g.50178 Transcript_21786/m.50178 type:complete len:369 (-) Transcript_21786:190-1296(-)
MHPNEFGVGSQIFVEQSIWPPPLHHDIGLGGIGGRPNLNHARITVPIRARFWAIAFQRNVQMISLLSNKTCPTARIVNNMPRAVIVKNAAIILRCISKMSSVKVGVKIEFFLAGARRFSLCHSVSLITSIHGNMLAIVPPSGGPQKVGRQSGAILFSRNAKVGHQRGIAQCRKTWYKPSLVPERPQVARRFNDTPKLQISDPSRVARPHFQNGMRAGQVLAAILGTLLIEELNVATVLDFVTPFEALIVISSSIVHGRVEMIKIYRLAAFSRFNGNGDIEHFAQQDLENPCSEKGRLPVLTGNSNFLVLQGRGPAVAPCLSLGGIFRVAGSQNGGGSLEHSLHPRLTLRPSQAATVVWIAAKARGEAY